MIDLHIHILPDIDDGSDSMGESLAMADLAWESGTTDMIITPHANQMGRFENFYSEEFKERFEELQRCLQEEEIPLIIYPGMEIYASEDMEEKIRQGKLIGLNHSRYYLVEFDFDERPETIQNGIDQIFRTGGIPLLAHPERYFCIQEYPILLYKWLQSGCFAQVNKGSMFGRFGSDAYETVQLLLEYNLVTCVASDAHGVRMRTPDMRDTEDYLLEQFGEDTAYRLLHQNPERILHNKEIVIHGRRPVGSSIF